MRVLGIDYGDKKMGLAFGESDINTAVPLEVIPNNQEETFKLIAKEIETEDIDLVVVGIPTRVNPHHTSEQLDKTQAFISKLKEYLSIPVEVEDESYTTVESLRLQQEEGAQADEDALAAMLIVQAYFNRRDE